MLNYVKELNYTRTSITNSNLQQLKRKKDEKKILKIILVVGILFSPHPPVNVNRVNGRAGDDWRIMQTAVLTARITRRLFGESRAFDVELGETG